MNRRIDFPALSGAALVAVLVVFGGSFRPLLALIGVFGFSLVFAAWVVIGEYTMAADEWLVLLLLVWAAGTAAVDGRGLLAAKEMVAAWMVAWFLWMLCRRATPRMRSGLLRAAGVVALLVSLWIVAEAVAMGGPGAGGAYANANVAAALVMPLIPALWLSVSGSGRWWWLLPLILVLGLAVLLTGSRAALLALVAAAAAGLPRGRVRLAAVLLMVVLVAAVVSWRFSLQTDSLAWHRVAIWKALAELVVENPVTGVGVGELDLATGPVRINHVDEIGRYGHRIGAAESTPIGVLVRLGWVGFGLAVAAAAVWLVRARRSDFFNVGGRAAVVTVMVVTAVFHDFLSEMLVLWWWAVILGCVEDSSIAGAPRARPWWPGRWLLGLAAGGVLLWAMAQPAYARCVWWSQPSNVDLAVRASRAERWWSEPVAWQLHRLLAQPEWGWSEAAEAVRLADQAVRLDARDAGRWSDRGKVHSRVVNELGQWPDSVHSGRESYRMSCELEPHLPWDWLGWAAFERSLGNLDASLALALRAVNEEPNLVRGWLFIARVQVDRGDQQAGREALDRAQRAQHLHWCAFTPYDRALVHADQWQIGQLQQALH